MKAIKLTFSILIITFLVFCFGYTNTSTNVVNAKNKPKKITLNRTSKELVVNQSLSLKVSSITPSKASKAVTWKTSNKSVATVSKKGVVKAKSSGNATITAVSKLNKKVKAKCKIKVLSYNVPELRLTTVNGTWACGEKLIQTKWKEMYPYLCKYMGEPDKISKEGLTVSWDDNINMGDLVDFKAETNTIYLGPLPHHNNLSKANNYDYEPFILQLTHETGHMFNQQGDKMVNLDFGQWAWEALTMVAESDYMSDYYGVYNRRGETKLDMSNLCGRDYINGVKYDGNKYSRETVDLTAASAFYYMSSVLSTKGTYDYWRNVNKLRMDDYKATGNTSLSYERFSSILDSAANSKTIDGKKPSEWLSSQAVSEIDGNVGDYLLCFSDHPADSWMTFCVSAWNRYTKEDGYKYETPYKGVNVTIDVTDPSGKKILTENVVTDDSGSVRHNIGSIDKYNLKDYTTLKITANATVNGAPKTFVTYHTYMKASMESDNNTTICMLIDKNGEIMTDVKSSDVSVKGASSVNKKALSLGTLVLKGEPGSTYTVTVKGKTLSISQPECRRVYPIVFE